MAIKSIVVPHIGDFSDVAVIEVYVKVGDTVEVDDSLIALESAKAVTDIPSPFSGTITGVLIKEGDLVSEGTAIAEIEVAEEEAKVEEPAKAAEEPPKAEEPVAPAAAPEPPAPAPQVETEAAPPMALPATGGPYHATPSLRKYARELGVDLSMVEGSGPHGRILHSDVQKLVKRALSGQSVASAKSAQLEDFTVYGEIERVPLSRIQKISGPFLTTAWQTIPHVTQADEADVTRLEEFRRSLRTDVKLSILPFVIKALPFALKAYPAVNGSLDEATGELIHKHYYNIGVAVDTPEGLVVPVVRNVDQKSVTEIGVELIELSEKARSRKLRTDDLSGASFSVSSLGGIGGTFFTPIISPPEVAILGLSKISKKPVWNGESFEPRDILPFSLSYDHRVVDGAVGVRFTAYLARMLEDLWRAFV